MQMARVRFPDDAIVSSIAFLIGDGDVIPARKSVIV